MISSLCCANGQREPLARTLASLGASAAITSAPRGPVVAVSLKDWNSANLDLLKLDWELNERAAEEHGFCLVLLESTPSAPLALEQVLTRYQRLLPWGYSLERSVERVLPFHRELFDVSKPLVRADYDHALDTWRWLLRLDLGASAALQLAALFHDIERLDSEADRRVEHLAPSYERFKTAHAHAGAARAADVLSAAGVSPVVVARARWLVESHEAPGEDAELLALNDADGLSFFSLNAWGFAEYFGAEHVRRKVRYTLQRMRPRARRFVARFRHHPRIQALLDDELRPLRGAESDRIHLETEQSE